MGINMDFSITVSNMAVCGYDCNNCPIFKATISEDVNTLRKIYKLSETVECNVETHGCKGCLSGVNNHMCDSCQIKNCADKRNIDSCGKCDEYPCDYVIKHLSKETIEVLDKINMEYKKK